MLLTILLLGEFAVRIFLEVREMRLTGIRFGVFSILRLLPLVNDLAPLPEKRGCIPEDSFVKMHEAGHERLRHAILRNLFKVILMMLAVWFLATLLVRFSMPIPEAVLYLHLVAIPVRLVFHFYCWNQEFEADRFALDSLGRKVARNAMRTLRTNEYPYTPFFAIFYREHPPAILRERHLGVR